MTERLRGSAGQRQRKRIMTRDYGLCQACQRRGVLRTAVEVDHIIALMNGGTNDDSNMESLCDDCHVMKTRADKGLSPSASCSEEGIPNDPRHHWNS
jgi:5-methylcytosine-specific restriction protein A